MSAKSALGRIMTSGHKLFARLLGCLPFLRDRGPWRKRRMVRIAIYY